MNYAADFNGDVRTKSNYASSGLLENVHSCNGVREKKNLNKIYSFIRLQISLPDNDSETLVMQL